jgi:predicted metalloprotease with PDZ domain
MLLFNRSDNAANTTISYYDKGAVLGMLLDLKIRNDTGNKRSLDDVMRLLYRTYYKEKKRGFTDHELWKACEIVAGGSLREIFEYASTVREINYPKYFSYAGLDIDVAWKKLPTAYFGATVRETDEGLAITGIDMEFPCLERWLKQPGYYSYSE